MDEAQRRQRNADRLAECHPKFGDRMKAVIGALEAQSFRPRIQEGWRSEADQLKAFNSGHSKLKFGYHNATGKNGEKEALAVDLLDDDAPLNPSVRYLLALAVAARGQQLQTGLKWGLPDTLAKAIEDAIVARAIDAPMSKVGWDPCHVEITGLTVDEVKAGKRP